MLKSNLRNKILKIREKNKKDYEKIIQETTREIENFVEKANLENPIQ